jgi:hypothetical protein
VPETVRIADPTRLAGRTIVDPITVTLVLAGSALVKLGYDILQSTKSRARDEQEEVLELKVDGKTINLPRSYSQEQIEEVLKEAIGEGSQRPAL